MQIKLVYALVSTRTKNRIKDGRLQGYARTINPETLDYEAEEGIMNCFESVEQAAWIREMLGSDKQVSILGVAVPKGCVVPKPINRRGHKKLNVARHVEQHFGVRNYLGYLEYGEETGRYVILTDLSCLIEIFDPDEEKEEPMQEARPAVKEKKPGQTVRAAMQETFKDVLSQTDKEEGTPAWVMPSVGGMLFGFLMGIAFSRCVREYPLATATVLPVIVAVLVIAGLYKYGNRMK